MISTTIIQILYIIIYTISAPFLLLPDVTIPVAFENAIATANGYLVSLNGFLPIDTILTILEIFIVIETAYLTFKLIMWVIRRLPTQS